MKALVPKQEKNPIAPGTNHTWTELATANKSNLANHLFTPSLNPGEYRMSQIISGIPSPFARVEIFKYALRSLDTDGKLKTSPDQAIYEELLDEWKGLVACILFDSSEVEVAEIELYTKTTIKNEIFKPQYALGSMLFEELDLWVDKSLPGSNPPKMHVILHNKKVIGGLSPHTLFFTAPQYDNLRTQLPFYDKDKKHFVNPTRYLNREQLNKLLAYLRDLSGGLASYYNYFGSKKLDGNNLEVFIQAWMEELQEAALTKYNTALNKNAIPDPLNKFSAPPFSALLNAHTDIYSYQGNFFTKEYLRDKKKVNSTQARKIQVNSLFLRGSDDNQPSVVMLPESLLQKSPNIEMLKAIGDDKNNYFFALPLSKDGLLHFQHGIDKFLKTAGNSLTARYLTKERQLYLNLKVTINEGADTIVSERKYNVSKKEANCYLSVNPEAEKVLIWPNFISPHWSRYYIYSELIHDKKIQEENSSFSIRPILGKYNDKDKRLNVLQDNTDNVVYASESPHAELIVSSHFNKVGDVKLRYELFESKYPFHSLEVFSTKGNGRVVGYLLLNNGKDTALPYDTEPPKQNATVGFDFGSNNICISYTLPGKEAKLLALKNRRVPLIGREGSEDEVATPDRLFFFPIRKKENGQFRSYVLMHDESRIDLKNSRKAMTGGVPVLEKNLPIEGFGGSLKPWLTVRARDESNQVHYNLKWRDKPADNEKKEALVRSIWLLLSAELYAEYDAKPSILNWAYPATMPPSNRIAFRQLWSNTANQSCFKNGTGAKINEGITESEAVCRFALSTKGKVSISDNILFVGFDVGGSTTDILILGRKKIEGNYENVLLKQSSVLASAEYLVAAAASEDNAFRQAIKKFIQDKKIKLHDSDKISAKSSHYFLNLLFDELDSKSLEDLYNHLYTQGARSVFTAASYVSGLLLFYGGMLVAQILHQEEHKKVNTLQMGYYGKGGRIFSWMKILGKEGRAFLEDSFKKGLMIPPSDTNQDEWTKRINELKVNPADGYHEYNKAEVSLGLAREFTSIYEEEGKAHEIVGEKGFLIEKDGEHVELHPQDIITSDMLEKFNGEFRIPERLEILQQYLELFIDFARPLKLLDNHSFMEKQTKLKQILIRFVNTHPFYEAALKVKSNKTNTPANDSFGFKNPMFILAGLGLFKEAVLDN